MIVITRKALIAAKGHEEMGISLDTFRFFCRKYGIPRR